MKRIFVLLMVALPLSAQEPVQADDPSIGNPLENVRDTFTLELELPSPFTGAVSCWINDSGPFPSREGVCYSEDAPRGWWLSDPIRMKMVPTGYWWDVETDRHGMPVPYDDPAHELRRARPWL